MWHALTYAAIVSCVGFIGSGVISSPMSTSSKYTAFPRISPSFPRCPRFASDLRLLNDGHFLALLILVSGLADDKHHLTCAARLLIHVGDTRFHGDGVARTNRGMKLAPLSRVEAHLAKFHFRIEALVGTKHIVEDRRCHESTTGGLLGGLRIDILRAGFADGLCKRQHHVLGDPKCTQHKLLAEDVPIELDHGLPLLFTSFLDAGIFEGNGTIVT